MITATNTASVSASLKAKILLPDISMYRFGFIVRYPQDRTAETGYQYEPWHLRYVGVYLATKLYNNGDWLSLEEYFGITSEYPN